MWFQWRKQWAFWLEPYRPTYAHLPKDDPRLPATTWRHGSGQIGPLRFAW